MIKNGFTLIELLVVVSIAAILIFFTTGLFGSSFLRGRDYERKNDLNQYKLALANYSTQNNMLYPVLETESSANTVLCPLLAPNYLTKCLEDPMYETDASYTYYYQSSNTGSNFVLWAKMEAGIQNWVVCSNGKTGSISSVGFSVVAGNCPL